MDVFFDNDEMSLPLPHQEAVIGVAELNQRVGDMLANTLAGYWIEGEISRPTRAASGHWYFSIKDNSAQLRCVMFRMSAQGHEAVLTEGAHVQVQGRLGIYAARGDFQLVVQKIRQTGAGALFAAFEALKKKLAQEGLFAPQHKKALPRSPNVIGIVTSPAAAALRDVVTTLKRRNPTVRLIVYPTTVQGKTAAREIAHAIAAANEHGLAEVLLLCRGGGSLEDLWAFNEEVAVRAVAASALPIISGVGHETDFTLCDFAADLRAATPTAAAEVATLSLEDLGKELMLKVRILYAALFRHYSDAGQKLDRLAGRLLHPRQMHQLRQQKLQHLELRIRERMRHYVAQAAQDFAWQQKALMRHQPKIDPYQARLDLGCKRLGQVRDVWLGEKKRHLAMLEAMLQAVSPRHILQRGYSVVRNQKGQIVRSHQNLSLGEKIQIRFYEGETTAVVAETSAQQDLFD